ncbi:Oidioi.mRNA.OKI2018_I69.chr2.g6500.t1.cds [Oikopleura dioica]|uniref:Oidioi.mRNA.OKI2018_I69.chr2.g6500.t1.cds n=1 Tax=Oikopleura dioica TaxID=34765 RepID=A0ABN7T469_OIKDI|nr:Oidioi.mRNA.OKI2018_I69.chr2.g6500.t1.cds [Oikopleura dioica]
MKSEKSEFLQRLRAILLLEKNGASENTVIQLFHDVIGEDLRATVTGFGYSGISDPDFLDDHSDVIKECYGRYYGIALEVQMPLVSLINSTEKRVRTRSRQKGNHENVARILARIENTTHCSTNEGDQYSNVHAAGFDQIPGPAPFFNTGTPKEEQLINQKERKIILKESILEESMEAMAIGTTNALNENTENQEAKSELPRVGVIRVPITDEWSPHFDQYGCPTFYNYGTPKWQQELNREKAQKKKENPPKLEFPIDFEIENNVENEPQKPEKEKPRKIIKYDSKKRRKQLLDYHINLSRQLSVESLD